MGLLFALGVTVGCAGDILRPGDADGEAARGEFASESGVRRLTTHELDNTLFDLLGDDRRRASATLVVDAFAPFDNDYTKQLASGALITSLEVFAADVADHVMSDARLRDAVVPCTPSGRGDADCFRAFVETFAPRALRRPVSDDEVEAYMGLLVFSVEANADVENDFYTGVGLVIRAILMDPEFLYRIEVGVPTERPGVFALDSHEVATRMSYLLWATTPDDALLEDAADGVLETGSGRREVAERMLADPRARDQLRRFHAMWLGYRILPHDADLVADFAEETGALIDRVVFDDPQSYLNLFTFDETYLTDDLAQHYGLPAPAGGSGWVAYPEERAGILSHGSVLSSFSKFADTSPTQRGILIRTRLMCQEIPPPPPTVDVDDPPPGQEGECKFERYAAHREASGCRGCHEQMDPIGFGLENFDMAGRYRTHDEGRSECVIAGDGALPDGTPFSGPPELAEALIAGGYIESCLIEQLYGFALGRSARQETAATSELLREFTAGRYDLSEFLARFIASERFAHRREASY